MSSIYNVQGHFLTFNNFLHRHQQSVYSFFRGYFVMIGREADDTREDRRRNPVRTKDFLPSPSAKVWVTLDTKGFQFLGGAPSWMKAENSRSIGFSTFWKAIFF